ncbi:MAG: DNA-directed RNA polymerase subunit N [Nitrososphaeraceae archaeon]|jgi:DNA-directed RNA polymerase subunit N
MHSCQKYVLIRPIVFIELMNGELHIMLVPVRCFTCGNLVAHKYAEYTARIKAGEDPAMVMDSLNIKRYCCRRMLISSVETVYQVIPYYEALRKRMSEIQSEVE